MGYTYYDCWKFHQIMKVLFPPLLSRSFGLSHTFGLSGVRLSSYLLQDSFLNHRFPHLYPYPFYPSFLPIGALRYLSVYLNRISLPHCSLHVTHLLTELLTVYPLAVQESSRSSIFLSAQGTRVK